MRFIKGDEVASLTLTEDSETLKRMAEGYPAAYANRFINRIGTIVQITWGGHIVVEFKSGLRAIYCESELKHLEDILGISSILKSNALTDWLQSGI